MTDTERIDWLEKNLFTLKNDWGELGASLIAPKVTFIRRTIRQTIDDAMRRKAT